MWTVEVLDEVERNLPRVRVSPEHEQLKDFPASALDPYDLDAVHPDDFLLDQLDLYPSQTLRCMREQIAAYRNPAMSAEEFLVTFEKTVPRFASTIREPLLKSLLD